MTMTLRSEVTPEMTFARAGASWTLTTSAAHSASFMMSRMSSATMFVGRGTVTAPLQTCTHLF